MAFALPVKIKVKKIHNDGIKIYYPKVTDLNNSEVQRKINREIVKRVERLINEQYKQQGAEKFAEMLGTFEVKTNERNVLSLTLASYAIAENYAHGLTLMDSVTFDVKTGKIYHLQDLFKGGSNYTRLISREIKQQIKERGIPVINSFDTISRNQPFYIADKSLVIYFQVYDITPGYVGIPMFPINAFMLEDIVLDYAPLGRMLPSL